MFKERFGSAARQGLTALALSAAAAGGAASPAAASSLRAIGTAPGIPAHTVSLGALPASTRLTVDLVFSAHDPAALRQFATAVSTPGNALYGHFLARGQFASRFGATPAAVAQVRAALQAAGLGAGHLSPNHLSLQVTAPAGSLGRALHVNFARLRLSDGRLAYAALGAPKLPASAASHLLTVLGLSNIAREHALLAGRVKGAHKHASVTGAPTACAAAAAVNPANQGAHSNGLPGDAYLTGDKVAAAYGVNPLFAGGQFGQAAKVAIYELEANFPADIPVYKSCFGISAPVSYTQVDGGAGTASAANMDGLETELDIENVINMAPQTSVEVYQGPNSGSGAYDVYSQIVNDDTAQVISISWGLSENEASLLNGSATLTAEEQLFEQAASQGQSAIAASGDSGAQDCLAPVTGTSAPVPCADDPASQPFVTGAGGTRLNLGAGNTRASEPVWNDGPAALEAAGLVTSKAPVPPGTVPRGRGAGGGGTSTQWGMPIWQYKTLSDRGWLGTAPNGAECAATQNATADPSVTTSQPYCREVPDVSANADPASGYVVLWNGGWTHVGGTSGASPTWAGLATLADSCRAKAGRGSLGGLNPVLYTIADSPGNYGKAFFDVTQGNNDYTDPFGGLTYPAGTGYDQASGLGSPNAGGGSGVVDQLCAA